MSDKTEIWKKRVAGWRASGETAKKYSTGRGWSAGTLLWWSSRLGREPPPAVRVAQLIRSPAQPHRGEPAGTIVVELLEARVRVTIEPGADREAAKTILCLLTSRMEP